MSEAPPVIVSRSGAVGVIELARPDKFNCLSLAVHAALEAAIDDFEKPGSGVRAVLIRAQGKHFALALTLRRSSRCAATPPRSSTSSATATACCAGSKRAPCPSWQPARGWCSRVVPS